jgi:aspartyl-tRNA(Asn)/glutamyl-tRNA(Gln) amidotransferase subunit A
MAPEVEPPSPEATRMSRSPFAYLTAAEIAAKVSAREVSAVDVMRATLADAEHVQGVLNCFITVAGDHAMAAAAEIDRRLAAGETVGPLAGVPLHVKDLVNTAGVRTTFGSHIYENNVPVTDSVSIARLKAAGAVLFAKTTTPEFGHMPFTEAPLFGRTRNAWDATRTSGGSSGGAAAACAAGCGPLAVATDAGGSTRIPAACNGVVGIKQTVGVVPHDMAPEAFGNLSYITPTTRTVLDTALMLEAMAGAHPSDPHSFGKPASGFVAAVHAANAERGSLAGVRMAWRPFVGNTAIDKETLEITEEAAEVFADLGATLEPMGDDMDPTEPFWLVLSTALWNARFSHELPRWGNRMSPTLVRQMQGGEGHTAEDLARALLERTKIYRKVQSWFERFDWIVMPTLSRTALPIEEKLFEEIEIEGRKAGSIRKAWYPYTHPFNLTGNPAITLPAGFHSDGLPVAIQLVGKWGADAEMLRLSALFEEARPWAERRPVV